MRSARRARIVGPLVVTAALLAGCSTDTTDFRRSAEEFIEADSMEQRAATTFTDARCDEPPAVAVDTTFTCTAIAADGAPWTFEVRIVQGDQFEISGQPDE